ncbi:hypothetical protein [Pseudoalteromonas sp. PS5]|uniref:hypothetical protein n=1 Tax=Pseudoalteromonas sp. PS5 TaxID=1437473 RepID=UPI000FFEA71F|nr:hypothetical protein [Pseudoalteromonas sp. PS5]RXF04351.1 hypothetical protein D9603_06175 [Pseudoalteromonas sp. PS5]
MQLFKNVRVNILTFCFIMIKELISKIIKVTNERLLDGANRDKYCAVATQCYRSGKTMTESQIYQIVGGSGLDQAKDPRGEQVNNIAPLVLNTPELRKVKGGSGLDQHKDPRGEQVNNIAPSVLNTPELRKVKGGSGGHHNDDPRGVGKQGELIRDKTASALTQHTLNTTQLAKIVGGSTGVIFEDPRAEGQSVKVKRSAFIYDNTDEN